jgi:hypothetical protein
LSSVALVTGVATLAVGGAATATAATTADTATGTPTSAAAAAEDHAAGWARPADVTHQIGGITETWSTGPIQSSTGGPIALSSPTVANLDGQPSVVVGDQNDNLYAFHLANPTGSPPAPTAPTGWPTTNESGPINSTPSVTTVNGSTAVLVGSGSDADPDGGYQAFSASGQELWFTAPTNPTTDAAPDTGVQAGITVGTLQSGQTDAVAGSLGQTVNALDPTTGALLTGWPFLNTDSTHSTAAVADLYGTGQNEIVVGNDQSAGVGNDQEYTNGGHIRILTAQGNQVCRADTDQTVDSSPAVGSFLTGGAMGIVTGTGAYFPGASDTDTVKAYDNRCDQVWSTTLDGSTFSSPALSDVLGNGSLQVVEGTDQGAGQSGSVYVLNAATGQVIWKVADLGRIIGSVVTADLTDQGYDDLIVPTINGAYILDGQTGAEEAILGTNVNLTNLGLQNSPLVTDDPNGTVGITLAGYVADPGVPAGVGEVVHYEIAGSNGAAAVGAGSWPMFHHDPQLTGDAGSGSAGTPTPATPACSVPAAVFTGYDLVAADGGIFNFGGTPFCGSTGGMHLNAPIVGMALDQGGGGYWEVASDGGIFTFGGANFYGSEGGKPLNQPIVGMAATPDGKGYWEVASDGGIFTFGDAAYYGSEGGKPLNQPIVGMAATPDGKGYRLVASDGGIFTFGDAHFDGSMGGQKLNRPIVGLATDVFTGGYWEVASDGGIFTFGGAPFFGSTGALALNAPIVGMAATANASGYRFGAADGGVFSFNAPFDGSEGGRPLNQPIVGMAGF